MRFINSASVWVGVILILLASIPAIIFAPRQGLFETVDIAIMAIAAGIVVGYARTFCDAMRLPVHVVTAGEVLIVGMVICSVAVIIIFGGQWIWRAASKPDYIVDSAFLAFSRWMFAAGAFIVLATVDAHNGVVGARSYRRAAILVALSVAAAAILISCGIG